MLTNHENLRSVGATAKYGIVSSFSRRSLAGDDYISKINMVFLSLLIINVLLYAVKGNNAFHILSAREITRVSTTAH